MLAGLEVALAVFRTVDSTIRLDCAMQEGAPRSWERYCRNSRSTRALLTAERVALNLLQRLSGVATATRRYVESIRHTGARIIDTRKTTPGLRLLESTRYGSAVGTIIVLVWETACSLKTTILLLLAVLLPRSIWHGRPSPTFRKSKWKSKIFPTPRSTGRRG